MFDRDFDHSRATGQKSDGDESCWAYQGATYALPFHGNECSFRDVRGGQ